MGNISAVFPGAARTGDGSDELMSWCDPLPLKTMRCQPCYAARPGAGHGAAPNSYEGAAEGSMMFSRMQLCIGTHARVSRFKGGLERKDSRFAFSNGPCLVTTSGLMGQIKRPWPDAVGK